MPNEHAASNVSIDSTHDPLPFDQARNRFEIAWSSTTPPEIAEFLSQLTLAGEPDSRRRLLVELIPIDMEYRWRAWAEGPTELPHGSGVGSLPQRCSLEDYQQRFPEIAGESVPMELILAEYRIRCRAGQPPAHAEYVQRFPKLGSDLQTALNEVDLKLSQPAADTDQTQSMRTWDSRRTADPAGQDLPTIPGYRITGEIARGGMGRVLSGWEEALERAVAIKTLLPGASAERFVTEAKITAKLPHPGIPPVHAIGTLDDGSPFLAMKFVGGHTLDQELKARTNPLDDLPRFLQVFEQISQAVGFAHAQGVVHRDLKPANVMVGNFGEVQVMDWGLAKDIPAAETDSTDADIESENDQQTQAGVVMGTLGYMPPEQARGEAVGTQADVFSLGSILCNMLTGQPAFVGTSRQEILRSSAAGNLKHALSRLETCGADPELVELTRNCLAAAPADRPVDANAVAELVTAYRLGVEARLRQAETDQAAAVVREVEQRKRRVVMQWGTGLVAAILLLGVIGTSVGMYRAETQRALAETAANNEKTANELTQKRLKQIETINDTVFDIFRDFDIRTVKEENEPLEYVLRKRLIAAGRNLDERAIEDPLVLAKLQIRLGYTLITLDESAAAIEFCKASFETRREKMGPDHTDTLTSMNHLGEAYLDTNQFNLALPLLEERLRLTKAKFGSDDPETLLSMNNLAMGYSYAGQHDLALPLLEETVRLRKLALGPGDHGTIVALGNLAGEYRAAGKLELAMPMYEEAFALAKAKLGPDHPDTLFHMCKLGGAYKEAGKLNRAIPLLEEALSLVKSKLGPDHALTLGTMQALGAAYENAGKYDLALPLLEESLKLTAAKYGESHPDTLVSRHDLALCYRRTGKVEQALTMWQEIAEPMKSHFGADHPETLKVLNGLAIGYRETGKVDLAIPLYEELLEVTTAKQGRDHPSTVLIFWGLALCYRDVGNVDLSLQAWAEAVRILEQRRFVDRYARQNVWNAAYDHERTGHHEWAETWRRKWYTHVREQAAAKYGDEYAWQSQIAILPQIATENPADMILWHQLCRASMELGKFDLALKAADTILKIEPDNLFGLLRKAEALEAKGDTAQATAVTAQAERVIQQTNGCREALQLGFKVLVRTDSGHETLVTKVEQLPTEPCRLAALTIDSRNERYPLLIEPLKDLVSRFHVNDIRFRSQLISKPQLEAIVALPNIARLEFDGSFLPEEGLAMVARMEGLTTLRLDRTSVSAAELQLLRTSHLRFLDVRGASIGDEHLREISHLSELIGLQVLDAKVSDQAIASLNSLHSLTGLVLAGSTATDVCLDSLTKLENVADLNLRNTQVNGSGFEALGRFAALQYLYLDHTEVDDTAIVHLEKLTQLRRLQINSTQISAEGVNRLKAALPSCEIIWDGGVISPNATQS